jgi:hypothetical protein
LSALPPPAAIPADDTLLSTTATTPEVSRLLEAGFDAVFTGEVSPDELPATLTRMLPARRPELSEACRVC